MSFGTVKCTKYNHKKSHKRQENGLGDDIFHVKQNPPFGERTKPKLFPSKMMGFLCFRSHGKHLDDIKSNCKEEIMSEVPDFKADLLSSEFFFLLSELREHGGGEGEWGGGGWMDEGGGYYIAGL